MKILITGAAGTLGRTLRKELRGRYELIVLDKVMISDLAPGEQALAGDITNLETVLGAMQDVDGVIHLAGIPVERSFEEILPVNVVGCWNIYEAARCTSAKRIVFASSNHAVGFYPRTQRIDADAPVRPDSLYGVSKCWGEALGHLYADKHRVKSLHIRIGACTPTPESERALSLWISGRDLAQLCRIGLEHPDVHSDIVYGISDNKRAWYDNANAFRLGYQPQDRAEDHVESAMRREAQLTHTPEDAYFQGGPFCAIGYEGGPVPPSK